jgi:hypothetical protein
VAAAGLKTADALQNDDVITEHSDKCHFSVNINKFKAKKLSVSHECCRCDKNRAKK